MKYGMKTKKLFQVSISGLLGFDISWLQDPEAFATKIIDALNFFVVFSAMIAVALIVVAGYNYITSMGDADKVEKAQKGVTAAVVGMIIVFLARVIIELVINVVVNNSLG